MSIFCKLLSNKQKLQNFNQGHFVNNDEILLNKQRKVLQGSFKT